MRAVSLIIYVAIPIFLVTMALERAWARSRKGGPGPAGGAIKGYHRADTLASLAMGIGNVIIAAGT